jgi:hypothetical protein
MRLKVIAFAGGALFFSASFALTVWFGQGK